jgi:hypothetical protein
MSTVPVVGQKAQFFPSTYGIASDAPKPGPLSAVVTQVWGPSCVNLEVTLGTGEKSYPSSVAVATPGFAQPNGYYCTLDA